MANEKTRQLKTPAESVRDDVHRIRTAEKVRIWQLVVTSFVGAVVTASFGLLTWCITYVSEIKKEGLERDKQLQSLIQQQKNDNQLVVSRIEQLTAAFNEYRRTTDVNIEALRSKYEEVNVQLKVMAVQWQSSTPKKNQQ